MKKADIETSRQLQRIAQILESQIEKAAGQKMAFTLIIFSPEDNGRANYISNCAREDSVRGLKQYVKHLESGMPDVPNHHIN